MSSSSSWATWAGSTPATPGASRGQVVSGPSRGWLAGLALSIALSTSALADSPVRIASINLCTDQLALALLPPDRIISLSYLAGDPNVSYFHRLGRLHPANRATAEELLPLKPDLVLADRYAGRPTVAMLQRFGVDVWFFDQPTSVDGIGRELRRLGAKLGEMARADMLVTEMHDRIAAARRRANPGPTVAFYYPNSWASGPATLADSALRELGLANAVATAGYQSFSLERLLTTRADYLALPTDDSSAFSQAAAVLGHPAVLARWPKERQIQLAGNMLICGGPFFADAVEAIADATRTK